MCAKLLVNGLVGHVQCLPGQALMLGPVTGAAMPTLGSSKAMNLVISGLERRRLVRRRPDPKHRQVLRASVTTTVWSSLALCDRSVDRIEADMLGDLPPETVEVVRTAMASFSDSLQATSAPRA